MITEEKLINYEYDIALSFAGEDRDFVEEVALLLKAHGVKVFYDKFEEDKLWGKNLYDYLNSIYTARAKFTIMFISEHYKRKLWTNHERESMQERAFHSSSEYILPARFDNTQIPGVSSTTGYIDLNNRDPSYLVSLVLRKIDWQENKRWWGTWEVETVSLASGSLLNIFEVKENGFTFDLSMVHGAHTGEISGKANFISNNEAIFSSEETNPEDICKLTFTKTNDEIQVDESDGCRNYCGMRAYFRGDYLLKKNIFYNMDAVNDIHLTEIYSILKEKYWIEFIKNFSDIQILDSMDDIETKVISGGMPGLYTICEGIIMLNKKKIWGAFLDDETVYHFTNTNEKELPKTIEEWKLSFDEKAIVRLG